MAAVTIASGLLAAEHPPPGASTGRSGGAHRGYAAKPAVGEVRLAGSLVAGYTWTTPWSLAARPLCDWCPVSTAGLERACRQTSRSYKMHDIAGQTGLGCWVRCQERWTVVQGHAGGVGGRGST